MRSFIGNLPRLAYPRTAVAAVLILGAVAVPCAAWFYAGYQQLDQEASLNEKALVSRGYKSGVVLAERLATRFELLREAESQRPFYHYQNLFHDPKGASEGLSVSVSPLAEGPGNPLIEAHFQVDETGHLGLPTLNDEFPDLGLHSSGSAECEILWKLQDVAVFTHLDGAEDVMGGGSRWPSIPWTEEDEGVAPVSAEPEAESRSSLATFVESNASPQVETLSVVAWQQHLNANALYADIKYGTHEGAAIACRKGVESELDQVEVTVGPIRWHTLPIGDEPTLVALRSVETPAGTWAQGFAISSKAVEQYLESSSFPARFEPRGESRQSAGTVATVVDGTPWQVSLDLSGQTARRETEQAANRLEFYEHFLLVAFGAALAGLLVVAMVFHSERLAQQRAQFAATAAHELRTPLAGLRLYGEMLAEGLGDPKRARDYARRMAGEAERLGRVVTNVLSFTRLERSGLALATRVGDLEQAVREAYQRQRLALEESGAEVKLDFADDLPAIAFDRDAVTHIVQNLLDNAEKYTRDIEGREIVLGLAGDAESVVLSVADNGRGIAKHLRRRLFRPFTRGQVTDAPEGLGLGLVLVRMLARAQGAEITYEDAPTGGAVFRVTFPVPSRSTAASPAAGSALAG